LEDLSKAVRAQWEKAAGERGLTGANPINVTWTSPSLAIAGSVAAAVSSQRFAPLPGLLPAGAAQLASGQISNLYTIYGGLGSGRLIIAGAPGSGKSGAAILLLLDALRHRDQASATDKPEIPVPALLTAQDWNPDREPVTDWLTRQLLTTYPQLAGLADAATARAMVTAGRIAIIIDGLDEIAAKMRPVALRALSQQGNFRIVILSRTTEMAYAASRQGILQGAAAIELQPVSPAEAADYLDRVQLDPPPEGWHNLTRHLRDNPAGPLSVALNNPLSLALVRDTCQCGDDTDKLLEFCTTLNDVPIGQAAEAITDYLLDKVLPAAYTRQPGQPPLPYDLPTAQNALTKIAAQMNQQGTRDLYWWHIVRWVPRSRRPIMSRFRAGFQSGLAFGLVAGLTFGLVTGLNAGLNAGLTVGSIGLVAGLFAGMVIGLGKDGKPPIRTTRLQFRKGLNEAISKENQLIGLAFGLLFGLAFGLLFGLARGPIVGLAFGLAFGLGSWLWSALTLGLLGATMLDSDTGGSQSPTSSWRYNWNYALLVMLAAGVVLGLAAAYEAGYPLSTASGIPVGITVGIAFGLTIGLTAGCTAAFAASEAFPAFLASVQIAIKWHMPVHLMKFLEDAHSRDVLRTVGPAYQFRHARLQDRLAAASFRDSSML
jgi:hypothetical protein